MKNITRTIITIKATAMKLGLVDGQPVAETIALIDYLSTKESKLEARKEFKAAGIDLPRGCEIMLEVVSEEVYGCTFEEFMSVARVIEGEAEKRAVRNDEGEGEGDNQ